MESTPFRSLRIGSPFPITQLLTRSKLGQDLI